MKALISSVLILSAALCQAQFDGAAGTPGSLAIHKDSSIIIAWANTCTVQRGWIDASNTSLGQVSHGSESSTLGPADGGVLSLGDSGVAVLTFNPPIRNGAGPDFAVFENSFSDNFLELAFVEVSSNGVDFYRFPATSNYPTTSQIGPFDDISDPTLINNLAGKYRSLFGTPFDLSELDSISELNLDAITHVKIIDVVGSINPSYGSSDKNGNLINDPFPTAFATGGFDLDAVAVIHQSQLSLLETVNNPVRLFPNPIAQGEKVKFTNESLIKELSVLELSGKTVFTGNTSDFESQNLSPGCYFVQVRTEDEAFSIKLVVR